MAENSLSQAVSFINDNSTMEIGLTVEGQPAVRSDIVAYHFHRNHKNVLRDIAKLRVKCPESFYRLNFEPVEYTDAKGEKRPAYLLTRDAFSLLVMGFTGVEAVKWKIRYIEAFNTLEAAALDRQAELAREAGYLQGKDEAISLPAVKKERQAGYLAGMKEGEKLQKRRDGLRQIMRIRAYRKKGLTQTEIGRILGISRDAVRRRMMRAREMGVAI